MQEILRQRSIRGISGNNARLTTVAPLYLQMNSQVSDSKDERRFDLLELQKERRESVEFAYSLWADLAVTLSPPRNFLSTGPQPHTALARQQNLGLGAPANDDFLLTIAVPSM